MPWPNSCGAVPVKKLVTVPWKNSAISIASQLSCVQNQNTVAPVSKNSPKCPPAWNQAWASLRRDSSRSAPGFVGQRYQSTRSVFRTSESSW